MLSGSQQRGRSSFQPCGPQIRGSHCSDYSCADSVQPGGNASGLQSGDTETGRVPSASSGKSGNSTGKRSPSCAIAKATPVPLPLATPTSSGSVKAADVPVAEKRSLEALKRTPLGFHFTANSPFYPRPGRQRRSPAQTDRRCPVCVR